MSEFDDIDLSNRLRVAAGNDPDLAIAHLELGRRVARARRRRAAVTTGAATVSMLMMGTVYAWQSSDDNGRITAADSPVVSIDASTSADETATSPATTVSPTATTPVTSATIDATPSATVTAPAPGGTDDTDDTDGVSFEEMLTAGTTTLRTIDGTGGTITVLLATSASGSTSATSTVRLTASAPAGGFIARTTTSRPDEVSVELTSDNHRTRIRVRLDDARLRVDVDETRTGPAAGTAPGATAPGGSGPSTTDRNDDNDDNSGSDNDDNDGNSGSDNDDNGSDADRSGDSTGSGDDS